MIQTLKEVIAKRLDSLDFEIKISDSPERGHMSTNAAFLLAEKEKLKPEEAAEEIRAHLHKYISEKYFERIEIAGGFVNMWFSEGTIRNEFERIVKAGANWGRIKRKNKENVIVEYSSPNIAKPMHVGHMRSTIIGDSLANIHEFLGYRVIRWNYLGDWGTQFGKLIAAYKKWGKKKIVKKDPIEELNKLYVRFHDELKEHPELEQEGQNEFKKLEGGDKGNLKLWKWFKAVSMKEFNRLYNLLGVRFTVEFGEAFYKKQLGETIDWLKREGLAKESEGALIVDLERFDLPPAMIRKSDEATLYLTRDIANLKYRIDEYKPKKILYVVGNEQALHFSQLFAIAEMLDFGGKPELEHIKHGLVLGEDGKKLATREGRTIRLKEILDRSIAIADKSLEERQTAIKKSEVKEVSEMIGVGAVKYADLSQNRMSDIVFDWDKMLSFEGNSAPYIQYTYARLRSILGKAKKIPKADLSAMNNEKDFSLVLKLSEFPEVVKRVAENYYPHYLAGYLYDLSREINAYYQSEPVLYSEPSLRGVRLNLIQSAANTLKTGLGLLGIKTVERM